MIGLFLPLIAVLLALRFIVAALLPMANTNVGALQISDGYASPTQVLPANGETINWFIAGNQTTGTEKLGYISPYAGTIVDVRAYLTTAPTTTSFIVDLMKNGITMFTTSANRPTIAATANASSTTLPDIVAVAVGDRLRLDIIQIGSGTAGANLYVTVTIRIANIA